MGKGKGKSDEARVARQEMEALAAGEKAKLAAELTRAELKARAEREQAAGHLNAIKLHNQWRKLMRAAKAEELRGQVEVLSQQHAREMDRKDAAVQLLDRDLEEAEQQHVTALRAHMRVVDSLLDLQASRLAGLEAAYNSELREMLAKFAAEHAEITSSHMRQKKELQEMAEAMKAEFADAESDARQEFESAREEVRNRNSEEYNVLKIQLEGIIEELERHFEQAHKAYLEGTEHRTSSFHSLTKSDAAAARVIEQRMKQLAKLQEALGHWRAKIASSGREWAERNAALRREKELLGRHYASLKGALAAQRGSAAARLAALSVASGGALQELRRELAKADSVLKLAEMCRGLETEQEKVLPFCSAGEAVPLPPLPEVLQQASEQQQQAQQQQQQQAQQQQQQQEAGQPEQPSQQQQPQQQRAGPEAGGGGSGSGEPRLCAVGLDDDGNEVQEWDYLNRFFKRYNKVVLDVAAVSQERARLEAENERLRQLLKAFLDGISVNDAVLNEPANPLLVINQRLQLVTAERRRQRSAEQQGAGASAATKGLGSADGSKGSPLGSARGAAPGALAVVAAGAPIGRKC